MKQLACLGSSASVATLTIALGLSADDIHAALWEAVRTGLVFRSAGTYSFLHDRVREAAYALIPASERAAAHLRIGRSLVAQTPASGRDEAALEAVNQFNRAAPLITSVEEREQVAELNLVAGRRAKAATAYASALTYFTAGGALLAEDRWERTYSLAFALELERAECEFLTGELTAAEEHLSALSRLVVNAVDLGAVTCVRIPLFATRGQGDRAVEICLEYLHQVGIDWAPRPTDEEVLQEYEQLFRKIGTHSVEAILDLPAMSDPDRRATMDVLTAIVPSAFSHGNLLGLCVARMVNLSLEHGIPGRSTSPLAAN